MSNLPIISFIMCLQVAIKKIEGDEWKGYTENSVSKSKST